MTVAELNRSVKDLLEGQPVLQDLWLRAELSGYTGPHHSSGHHYFRMKDDKAEVDCVMWRGQGERLSFTPEDGMEVLARGNASLYERGGRFQFYVSHMQPAGMGDLHARYLALKKELTEEGLFEQARKRPIPSFALSIGVVTSKGAAALQDVLNVLSRRSPHVHALLAPAKVQGDGAAETVAQAIEQLNQHAAAGHPLDVILVVRGGGSLEDLWAFNEEVAVRAVAESRIPVIAGVGHETDTTLIDLAADARAPTPSAAAELAAPSRDEVLAQLTDRQRTLIHRMDARLSHARTRLEGLADRPVLNRPEALFADARQRTDELATRLPASVELLIERAQATLAQNAATLDALSPLKVLSRGYAVVQRDGQAITSIQDVQAGERLDVRVTDGTITTQVDSTQEAPP